MKTIDPTEPSRSMARRHRDLHDVRGGLTAALMLCAALAAAATAYAVPHFARQYDVSCTTCHVIPPKLNEVGLAFKANGYRSPSTPRGSTLEGGLETKKSSPTVPFSSWLTGRYEDPEEGVSDAFLPKVELIGGGPLGQRSSYFVEWRLVSLSLRGDGSLQDRGGRFEDAFLDWGLGERHTLTVGQFRSLNQVDVSRRLSPSEPLLFRNGLPTDTDPDPRIASLLRFSPSSRSPGFAYSVRSIAGPTASDGLFHFVTVPFTGELSIPLSREASEEASFELQGPPKGVFLETFYRRGLSSYGVHAFVDGDAWLATGLAELHIARPLFLTAGFGVDEREDEGSRERYSVELEYLDARSDRWRGGAGIRFEDVTDDGRGEALVPYVVLGAPHSRYNLLFQLEYREQDDDRQLVFDVSAMF